MTIEVDEKLIKQVEYYTITNYEVVDGKMPVDNVECIIEDLLSEIHHLEDKNKDLENQLYHPDDYDDRADRLFEERRLLDL